MRPLILLLLSALASAGAGEEVRVGMETRTPPWSFIPDVDYSKEDFTLTPQPSPAQIRKLRGIDVDVAGALGRRLGATIRIVPFAWFDLEDGLLAGRFDLILNAWTPSPKTPRTIRASAPYYEWGLLLAVRAGDDAIHSFRDLRGRRLGHYRDPAVERSLRAFEQVELVARDAPERLFDELGARALDAVVFDSPYVRWRVGQDAAFKVVGEPLNKLGYHVGVRQSDEPLYRRVQVAVQELSASGELDQIRRRWESPSRP